MISNVLQDIVVIYHGNCPDGFSAAWVAHKKFGDQAFYYGLNHHAEVPVWLKDKEVYFVDFCFDEDDVMNKIIAENKKVVVIDHHISRKDATFKAAEFIFDINHCGSVLAWNYFFPSEKMPKLLDYVEDQDIWVWKNENAKEILSILGLRPYTFKDWDEMALLVENEESRKAIIHDGNIISLYQGKIIEYACKVADEAEFEGHKALVVNSQFLNSEIGHALAKNGVPIAIVWSQEGKRIFVSLRGDGTINLAELAAKYKGGGHHNASGFDFTDDQNAPWNLIEKS